MRAQRVVIESPYAGNVERHVAYAKLAVHDCLTRGEAPIASHLLFTQPGILNDGIEAERRLGISAGFAWHAVADLIVFYMDFGVSNGMRAAYRHATQAKCLIETRYIMPTRDTVIADNLRALEGD